MDFKTRIMGAMEWYLFLRQHYPEQASEGELVISRESYCSYLYAKNVLHGRFELGEAAIATDPLDSYKYAKKVLDGPFLMAERCIAQNGIASYFYATGVLNKRFILGEQMIFQTEFSHDYQKHFLIKIKKEIDWTRHGF